MSHHLVNHVSRPELRSDNTLHVVGVITNPVRYHSRYRLAREWQEAIRDTPNVKLHMVEAAFGDRHHEVTENTEHGLQVRTKSELWVKENLINLGVRHLLPRDWKYMAWVDADVFFPDKHWAQETMHQLQHWPVVQPWQQCTNLGFRGNILQTHQSFGWMQQSVGMVDAEGKRRKRKTVSSSSGMLENYPYGHTGYAWACTRDFWEQACGLMDWCILGSADNHMAWAMVGAVDLWIHQMMNPNFVRLCKEWQYRATRATHNEVGYVSGRIEHKFHGPMKRRFYKERWKLLVDHGYDPVTDLMRDAQGLLQLVGKPRLEQAIRLYNRSRYEDSIEEQ